MIVYVLICFGLLGGVLIEPAKSFLGIVLECQGLRPKGQGN